jgi:hypothetical protein
MHKSYKAINKQTTAHTMHFKGPGYHEGCINENNIESECVKLCLENWPLSDLKSS